MPTEQQMEAAREMMKALEEAGLQIEYLHEKFQPTSSGVAVLSRITAALALAKAAGIKPQE